MKYIDWIRTLPCHCGDNTATEACHLRYSDYKAGKTNTKGAKPADMWLWPGCSYHHRMQHEIGERAFWDNFQMDPITYCLLLYYCGQDINKIPEIIEKSKHNWTHGIAAPYRRRSIYLRKAWLDDP